MSTPLNPCLTPFPLLIEQLRQEGYVIGKPPWVSQEYLLIDTESVSDMRCGHCDRLGLSSTVLHRDSDRSYQIAGFCPKCGMAELC